MDDKLQFIANLTDRQHSLMLNGKGDRVLIELEAFGFTNAAVALVGMAKFTGRSFLVTIQEVPEDLTTLDKFDDGTNQTNEGAKRTAITVGRRRTDKRRD
jgi:hypothetical protein